MHANAVQKPQSVACMHLPHVHMVECFRGVSLLKAVLFPVPSLVADGRNPADQPDLFTPFYSCPLATHIVFQVINIGTKPSDRGDD